MTIESAVISEWQDSLRESIKLHGLSISVPELVAVLVDASKPSAPTTLHERRFIAQYAELSDDDLTPEALTKVDVEIAANRAAAAQNVADTSLTTREVATVLGMAPANVRRAVGDGTLYSVTTSPGNHHRFPRWQFPHGRMLPGLREIVSALPSNYHPLEVEAFMTEGSETLHGMSPVSWLAGGGNVTEVVTLANERAWE